MIITEVKNSAKIFEIFNEMKLNPGFNPYLIFQALIPKETDSLTPETLFCFIKSQGFQCENFPFIQRKLFGDASELNFREFRLFFSQKDSFYKEPAILKEKIPLDSFENRRNGYECVVKRKGSYDYIEYLLKVRNTEAKVAKIQAAMPKKIPSLCFRKGLDCLFADFLQSQLNIEKEIESLKEDLALRDGVSIPAVLKLFDAENTGFITVNNLQRNLPKINIANDEKTLVFLVSRYAKSNRNYIRFYIFLKKHHIDGFLLKTSFNLAIQHFQDFLCQNQVLFVNFMKKELILYKVYPIKRWD